MRCPPHRRLKADCACVDCALGYSVAACQPTVISKDHEQEREVERDTKVVNARRVTPSLHTLYMQLQKASSGGAACRIGRACGAPMR